MLLKGAVISYHSAIVVVDVCTLSLLITSNNFYQLENNYFFYIFTT